MNYRAGIMAVALLSVLGFTACDPYEESSKAAPAVTGVFPVGDVIFVQFNKLLDGSKIQATPESCAPAAGWLSVTPAAASGCAWNACYSPQSPDPNNESSTVAIFQACGGDASGWDDPGPLTPATQYTITGPVSDKQGNTLQLNETATTEAAAP